MFIGSPLPEGYGIQLKMWAPYNAGNFRMNVLHLINKEWQVSSFDFTISPGMQGVVSQVFPVGKLNIIGVTLEMLSGGTWDYPFYADAYLVNNLTTNNLKLFKLFEGYITFDCPLSYPMGENIVPDPRLCACYNMTGSSSAGSNYTAATPSDVTVEVIQGRWTLNTSATVGARNVYLAFMYSGAYRGFAYAGSQALAASSTYYVSFGHGGPVELSQLPYIHISIPRNFIIQSGSVVCGCVAPVAGDQVVDAYIDFRAVSFGS